MPALPTSTGDLLPVLFGHAAFQHLNAACRLGLLEELHVHPGSSQNELEARLNLSTRALDVLLLGTTAVGLVTADPESRYRNTAAVQDLFAHDIWESFTALVEYESDLVYLSHSTYIDSLRDNTNAGLAWFPGSGEDFYQRLAADPPRERLFFRAMHAWSELTNEPLRNPEAFAGVEHLLDLGGGDAVNAITLAGHHPHLHITVLDTPEAIDIARENISKEGLTDRISCVSGDMFTDDYPEKIDGILLANQVSIWSEEKNLDLLRRAYNALPDGGTVAIFSEFVFGEGPTRLYAALDAVYFATLPTADSRLWSTETCADWMVQAGFHNPTTVTAAWTPHAVILAEK